MLGGQRPGSGGSVNLHHAFGAADAAGGHQPVGVKGCVFGIFSSRFLSVKLDIIIGVKDTGAVGIVDQNGQLGTLLIDAHGIKINAGGINAVVGKKGAVQPVEAVFSKHDLIGAGSPISGR